MFDADGTTGSCSVVGFVITGVKSSQCVSSVAIRTVNFLSYCLRDFALVAPVYYRRNKAELLLYLGGVYRGLMEPYNGQPSRTIMMKKIDKVGWI